MFSDTVLAREKKLKENNLKAEADSSSSDNSCFVASVTALNLQEDSLVII